MTTYTVYANDIEFGTYEASSEQAARDLCAQDAGYKSEADMVAKLDQPSELIAKLAQEKRSMDIELSYDGFGSEENVEEFAQWLKAKGHTVRLGDTSASIVDGRTALYPDDEASEIMGELWEEFCKA